MTDPLTADQQLAAALRAFASRCISNPDIRHDELMTCLKAAARIEYGRKSLWQRLWDAPDSEGVVIGFEQVDKLRASDEWMDLTRRVLYG